MKFEFKKKIEIDKANDYRDVKTMNLQSKDKKKENNELINSGQSPNFHIQKIKPIDSFDDTFSDKSENSCAICKEQIIGEIKRPHWKWNMDSIQNLCLDCYNTKNIEYERRSNYCINCNEKLKFIRYNPKPSWNINGQLCRPCWDDKNRV